MGPDGVGHGGAALKQDLQLRESTAEVEEGVPTAEASQLDDATISTRPPTTDDLASLAEALETQATPSHPFGRAVTTGAASSAAADDVAFDAVLMQVGLLAHAGALRAAAIVNVDELRDMTLDEMRRDVAFTDQEIARVLTWQQQEKSAV